MNTVFRKEEAAFADVAGSRAFRQCLGHFATGVAVATYETDAQGPRGLTVNSFTSVSLDPPLILLCLDKRSKARAALPNRSFAVNVLGAGQRLVAWHFAGRPMLIAPAFRYLDGIPLLEQSHAWLSCVPWSDYDAGDHIILVGRVVDFGVSPQEPLCFYRGEFAGVAPFAATELITGQEGA